ncbi:MAG: PQQ-binding-like beta-propeller repeat protein [Opitutales bacterium]
MIKLLLVSLNIAVLLSAQATDRWVKIRQANPLSKEAKTSDWPRFNGLGDDAKSFESHLAKQWPETGPNLLWYLEKGQGYASPAIVDGVLVLFHRMDGKEVAEGRNPETGELMWEYSYPVEYRDRYGYSPGPRASPVISQGKVYLHGVTAWLTCLDLATGKMLWKRDLTRDYQVPQYFFGKGSNPIVADDLLILNLGGGNEECMAAFDCETGETQWILQDEWGASYSSPTLATIHDRRVCLALTGGESKPATGGLLVLDSQTGEHLIRFPWRSRKYESATACPPLHLGENHVFLSECYDKGSVVLKIKPDFSYEVLWENRDLGIHWMTPIESGGYLYGVSGRHQQGAELFCVNWKTGEIMWKEAVSWQANLLGRDLNLQLFRASLLQTGDEFLALSEFGSFLRMNLSPEGWQIKEKTQLFFAPETWTLPALSSGLLYIMQNDTDRMSGVSNRLLCYDLRGE